MATWRELSKENQTAAFELFEKQRWRSCISRAYYAMYSQATLSLFEAGLTLPQPQPNPSHRDLPALIRMNLHSLSVERRWRLASLIDKAYALRIFADYVPSADTTRTEAIVAIGLMSKSLILLEPGNAK